MTMMKLLRRDQRGAAAIEFALSVPVLITMVYGIFQVGLLYEANAGMQHALGEGARLASVYDRNTTNHVPTDDAIKANVWDDNFGVNASAAGPGRNAGNSYTQADISAYVSTQALLTDAPIVDKQYYWRSCGDTIRELCDASFTAGTYLTAEIVAPTETTLELRTYTGQRGVVV